MSKKRGEESTYEEVAAALKLIEQQRAGRGNIFGIELCAHESAQRLELKLIKEEIEKHNRGHEGNTRRCPKCGKETQVYKGDREKVLKFESGELPIKRAYYVCTECGSTSMPLDEKLGIIEGQEQGRYREKLSLLGVLVPYHKAPEVCRTFFGCEDDAKRLRRVTLRESDHLTEEMAQGKELATKAEETVYVEIDGHMCPTREPRTSKDDQGYREAKVVMGFREEDIVRSTEKRTVILDQIIEAKIASSSEFRPLVRDVYRRLGANRAKTVVALADGAAWIWETVDDVMPEAVQILDYAHAKSYLYDAAEKIYGKGTDLAKEWLEKQQDLLFEDKVSEVIATIRKFGERSDRFPADEALLKISRYFENNKSRMLYGTYKKRGLSIGSGAIESLGKRIAQGRIKGCGMRWNIKDLNPLLKLRSAFFDGSWRIYWNSQMKLAA